MANNTLTENKSVYKDKLWITGIIIIMLGTILNIFVPSLFSSTGSFLGIILVSIGIIMIYNIFKS